MPPFLQAFMPHNAISWLAGILANCKVHWLKNILIRYFINRYPVNLEEAIETDPYAYPSFNAFFTRHLNKSLRPIASGIYDFISPVDGQISQLGKIDSGLILQAKKHLYTAEGLLGGNLANDKTLATPFMNGQFITLYLAPKDYHRVHMPIDGQLTKMIYVPGRLFSVNQKSAEHTANLFARNERVIAIFQTSIGQVAMVLIGAMIVGSIETIWAGTITPPRRNQIQKWDYAHPISLKRGEEMGLFKLGSTVIILCEENAVTFDPHFLANDFVKIGEKIGNFKTLHY